MATMSVFETPASVRVFEGSGLQNVKNCLTAVIAKFRHQHLNSVWALMAFKAVILAVSAYDIYLTVKYVEYLPQMETLKSTFAA